jgi:hypothetical protein
VSWSFSCWPGPIGCVCVWWGWSGVVTALPGGAGLREVPGRRIAGRQQVHGLAAAAGSMSKRVCGGVLPGGARGVVPWQGNPVPEVLLPAVPGSWTGAVHTCTRDRRRGWPGARTYGGKRRRSGHRPVVFMQVIGRVEVEVEAVAGCKTVGSAYVGSNPTPATTCENGLWAAETRPGGPFPSCHAMYQGVSPWVDA